MDHPEPDSPRPASDVSPDVVSRMLGVFGILRRRWLLIAAVTAACAGIGGVSIWLAQPLYQATTTLVLHMSGPKVLDKVEGVNEDAVGRVYGYSEYYETQLAIMRSDKVAAIALGKLAAHGLAHEAVFLGLDQITSEEERLEIAGEMTDEYKVKLLQARVRIEAIRHSRVVKVIATYPEPEHTATIADAVANSYLEHVQGIRSKSGSKAKDQLADESEQAKEELEVAEAALAKFKNENEITTISLEDRQNVVSQNIRTLSSHAKNAEADRIHTGALYEQAKKLSRAGNLTGSTLMPGHEVLLQQLRDEQVQAERDLERIKVEYGPKHPSYQKAERRLAVTEGRLEREGKELLASLRGRVDAALTAEKRLQKALETEHQRALALSALEKAYGELAREAKMKADAYQLVEMRHTEVGLTNRVEAEGIDILDEATVPSYPVHPRIYFTMGMALFAGLTLGSLLAIGVDLRDKRLRGVLDVERALAGSGLPVLGQLPLLAADTRLGVGNARAQRRQRDLYAHLYPQSLMAERCRGIRTSINFTVGGESLKTIMVTSPSSTEGKSSTVLNLAQSFCQAGKRVVIVDADMRRPRMHEVFPPPVEHEGNGLAPALLGTLPVSEAILPLGGDDAPKELYLMPCGTIPDAPAELLDSAACRKVLEELRDRFDVVLLDSPPVLPVTDPLILARRVDAVVMVARCGATTSHQLQRAIQMIAQGDTNLLGVVFNEVDTRRDTYSYDYGYTYYGAYANRGPAQEGERA